LGAAAGVVLAEPRPALSWKEILPLDPTEPAQRESMMGVVCPVTMVTVHSKTKSLLPS